MLEELVVNENDQDLRLDLLLAERLTKITRSHAQKLTARQAVKVNGAPAKASYKVRPGDVVIVDIPAPEPMDYVLAESIPLSVVYEDSHLIVIDKPKGMVVHPAAGVRTGTLVNALLAHCHDLSGIGGVTRPGIVHRLDKDTTGLIVVAKNDHAHLSLADQIAKREAKRKYQAVLWGRAPFKHAVIDAPIMRHPVDRKRMTVYEDTDADVNYPRRETDTRLPHRLAGWPPDLDEIERSSFDLVAAMGRPLERHGGGRPRVAVTELALIEHLGLFSLVEAILQTGRTHQIRVHCAFAGYPVVGDSVYGGERRVSADELRGQPLHRLNDMIRSLRGQALHAYSLAFEHPVTGKPMEFHAPLPAEMSDLIEYLRSIGNSADAGRGPIDD